MRWYLFKGVRVKGAKQKYTPHFSVFDWLERSIYHFSPTYRCGMFILLVHVKVNETNKCEKG